MDTLNYSEFNKIDASVVIIENQKGEFLLLKRGPKSKQQGWCLPGGRKEKNEELIDTAKRETFEETGLNIKKSKLKHLGEGLSVRGFYVSVFYTKIKKEKNINLSEEHTDYIWTSDYRKLDLAGNTGDYIEMV